MISYQGMVNGNYASILNSLKRSSMPVDDRKWPERCSAPEMSQVRFSDFLNELANQGTTQQELASKLRVTPAYICDCKKGRRSITELFARRLEHAFGRNHRWFLGTDSPARSGRFGLKDTVPIALPVLPYPIQGDPCSHRRWDGSQMELCGMPASRGLESRWPYIVRLGNGDRQGRLKRGDLILVSQTESPQAEVQVINWRRKVMIARRSRSGWEVLSRRYDVVLDEAEAEAVGHCVALVWAGL